MFNYQQFISDRKELSDKMYEIRSKFSELSDMGIDVDIAIDKLDKAIKKVNDDKISIVLVGAFSDGKTSVIAGWLNEKVSDMKISTDESSDEIKGYYPSFLPENCIIVDTPGLFGDKIGNDENGSKIILSDMTRKYISEAHIILYVVPAKNPIKDSHKECIRWILNDLNKLDTTIFVINKMDDVADLTDDEDFELQRSIKTKNLREKLLACGISENDANRTRVVCISAAPNGTGIEQWKDYREEYIERSRLQALEDAANDILRNSHNELIVKCGCDVLNDELNKVLAEINRQEEAVTETILPEKEESLVRNKRDLEKLESRILQTRNDIKADLMNLRKNKLAKIRAAAIDDYNYILEEEIGIAEGHEGSVLNDEIQIIYGRYAQQYGVWTTEVGDKFQQEYEKQNKAVNNMLALGAKGMGAGLARVGGVGVGAIKGAIFAGRDVLGKIGIVIKFKPWQVVKMATFASKALPIAGAAINVATEIVESVTSSIQNQKFEKSKADIKVEIENIFAEAGIQLNDEDWFLENFAPGIKVLREQIAEDERSIEKLTIIVEKYAKWKQSIDETIVIS